MTFAAAGVPNVTSATFALSAGSATQLGIATQPSGTVASGSALATPPAVQLRDAGGNAVSQAGVNMSVAISGAGASLTGTTTVATNASGIATFTGLGLTGTVNSYTLQFSSAGVTGATSSAISLTPGPAAALVMLTQPPATAISNSPFSTAPAVRLRDAAGNNVSQAGVNISATVTGGGATLIGTSAVATNASGVSTFTGLGIDGGGTYTITFAAAGLTSIVSSAVVVSETAAKVGMVTQPSASAQSGQAFATQPSVRLLSAADNPVSQAGVTVTVNIGSGTGGTLVGTASAITNASGIATFTNLGITGTVGSFTLAFSSAGLTGVSSGTINLTAGAAAKLLITQQPPSTVIPGATLTVVVRLADAQNNFVSASGISVNAALNGTPGTLNGTTPVATNASGTSSFGDLSITGSTLGNSHSITFSATGLTSATSTTIDIVLFDLVSDVEGVLKMTSDHEARLVALISGTKPVALHTLGLRTFSSRAAGFADRARAVPEFMVALHSSRYQP
jgi:hypothetical protein